MFDSNKKEKPFTSFSGFGGGGLGLAGGAISAKTYVDDVFSTFLYVGTGDNQTNTVTNGIDLADKGGMVWTKGRDIAYSPIIFDSERGLEKYIYTSSEAAQNENHVRSNMSFNSNGYSFGSTSTTSWGPINEGNYDFASWTFRKAPGFFDVVTYTGNGTAGRTVAHDLGSVPGMIIVKCLDVAEPWCVYHRSLGNNTYLSLSETSTGQTSTLRWNDTTPTSSVFTVGTDPNVNQNTKNYVAYIFAHDDASFGTDEDESIIKCGTYTGTGSNGNFVNVGFEPQWVLLKCSDGYDGGPWIINDTMRGMVNIDDNNLTRRIKANASDVESGDIFSYPYSNGFVVNGTGAFKNGSGNTYVYMAIRRPNKPPSAGIEVFAVDTRGSTGDGNEPTYRAPFPVDMEFNRNVNYSGGDMQISARLTQGKQMFTNLTNQESANSAMMFDYMNGVQTDTGTGTDQYAWMFKRAPGFFDVVTYTGDGSSNRQISHNLDAVPELLIVKQRDATREWAVYSAATGVGKFLKLRENVALTTQSGLFDTAPTSSIFTVETNTYVNISSGNYIAYLFATLPGISKVGSYTGTGNAINVDCGFTAGARFILIKRTDSSGDWYVWDSVRGIVSGNDPYLLLNSTAAQVTNTDYIDPLTSGFTVTSSAPDALNVDGGTYLFLAIA